MDYLPPSVVSWLEGRIVISFAASWYSSSVALAVETFTGGLLVLLLAVGPPWPYLHRKPIKYLPARKAKMTSCKR
ncbi:hypothetical protein M231_04119 [Tremella mesenterica]|uniref:Uncharacterized protein n=1 Tax=Tremella mesenterica TaxID=5217 RepID=A0A4Q1BLE8_TREME|nr:hypothetical protein M231_04119 [Tremella mesenterica]